MDLQMDFERSALAEQQAAALSRQWGMGEIGSLLLNQLARHNGIEFWQSLDAGTLADNVRCAERYFNGRISHYHEFLKNVHPLSISSKANASCLSRRDACIMAKVHHEMAQWVHGYPNSNVL